VAHMKPDQATQIYRIMYTELHCDLTAYSITVSLWILNLICLMLSYFSGWVSQWLSG